ncbi:hypothetical protein BN2476_370003 [Paraburkholderia piptadeniae]|uniref:Uncharacterized protein n=1 Tax=Paraburkholderia piptadeniae TaxID=1701573 RepID=A0A1N7S9G8_9BURK|nr:hypothetical protein BN2476_370003 [Paraburkholderia piptadeniae]
MVRCHSQTGVGEWYFSLSMNESSRPVTDVQRFPSSVSSALQSRLPIEQSIIRQNMSATTVRIYRPLSHLGKNKAERHTSLAPATPL